MNGPPIDGSSSAHWQVHADLEALKYVPRVETSQSTYTMSSADTIVIAVPGCGTVILPAFNDVLSQVYVIKNYTNGAIVVQSRDIAIDGSNAAQWMPPAATNTYYSDGGNWWTLGRDLGHGVDFRAHATNATAAFTAAVNGPHYITYGSCAGYILDTNVGGGAWDAPNGGWVVPVTGKYLLVGKIRPHDGITQPSNFAQGIDKTLDTNSLDWYGTSAPPAGGRLTWRWVEEATFSVGDVLGHFYYLDNGSTTIPIIEARFSATLLYAS